VVLAACGAEDSSAYEVQFEDNRHYTGAERELRFEIFVRNLKRISSLDGPKGMYGINAFTDVDWDTALLQPRNENAQKESPRNENAQEEYVNVTAGSNCPAYTDCSTCVAKGGHRCYRSACLVRYGQRMPQCRFDRQPLHLIQSFEGP
jgi:hypothetical protein